MIEDLYSIRVTVVEQAKDQPYSVLTEIRIIANDVGTQRYLKFVEADLDWIERVAIIDMLAEGTVAKELRIRLDDQMPKQRDLAMGDPKLGTRYHVVITSRRLGEDTGRDILLDLGGQLRGIREAQRQAIRKPTLEEQKRLKELQAALDQG